MVQAAQGTAVLFFLCQLAKCRWHIRLQYDAVKVHCPIHSRYWFIISADNILSHSGYTHIATHRESREWKNRNTHLHAHSYDHWTPTIAGRAGQEVKKRVEGHDVGGTHARRVFAFKQMAYSYWLIGTNCYHAFALCGGSWCKKASCVFGQIFSLRGSRTSCHSVHARDHSGWSAVISPSYF